HCGRYRFPRPYSSPDAEPSAGEGSLGYAVPDGAHPVCGNRRPGHLVLLRRLASSWTSRNTTCDQRGERKGGEETHARTHYECKGRSHPTGAKWIKADLSGEACCCDLAGAIVQSSTDESEN